LALFAPRRKVGAYAQSWRLRTKLAPTHKVGAYASFKKLASGYCEQALYSSPEFRVLVVEVPGNSWRALPHGEDLGRDLVALPLAAPRLAGRRLRELRVQVQLVDVDALGSI
jgi:hypothetical protein